MASVSKGRALAVAACSVTAEDYAEGYGHAAAYADAIKQVLPRIRTRHRSGRARCVHAGCMSCALCVLCVCTLYVKPVRVSMCVYVCVCVRVRTQTHTHTHRHTATRTNAHTRVRAHTHDIICCGRPKR